MQKFFGKGKKESKVLLLTKGFLRKIRLDLRIRRQVSSLLNSLGEIDFSYFRGKGKRDFQQ